MKCKCGHGKLAHLIEGDQCICTETGCNCTAYIPAEIVLIDDHGREFKTSNIQAFVESHKGWFDAGDVEHKKCPEHVGKRANDYWCRASRGLEAVANGAVEQWYGWRLK